jgi:hypothetical protein
MNSDFWKKFPAIPGFDCLKMKHDIQTKIHEETKQMTQEQRLEYYRRGAKKLRRSRIAACEDKSMFVREEQAPYGAKPRRKE